MAFYVGQKVECIGHPETVHSYYGEIIPEVGAIYTVRNIHFIKDREQLRFVEIVNPINYYDSGPDECCFTAKFFRPIVERKTDISIFKAMLTPKSEEVPA